MIVIRFNIQVDDGWDSIVKGDTVKDAESGWDSVVGEVLVEGASNSMKLKAPVENGWNLDAVHGEKELQIIILLYTSSHELHTHVLHFEQLWLLYPQMLIGGQEVV